MEQLLGPQRLVTLSPLCCDSAAVSLCDAYMCEPMRLQECVITASGKPRQGVLRWSPAEPSGGLEQVESRRWGEA
jgi:hypothetical protein